MTFVAAARPTALHKIGPPKAPVTACGEGEGKTEIRPVQEHCVFEFNSTWTWEI